MKKEISLKMASLFKDTDLSDKPWLIEWVGVGVISFLAFISFVYNDMRSLTVWSVNLLEVTFRGDFFSFYEYTHLNSELIPHKYMGGDVLGLIPWSIWNIPNWLIQKLTGASVATNPFLLAWSKLFLVVVLLLVSYYAYKISMLVLDNDKVKSLWVSILTLSSIYTIFAIYYAGQTDILVILFTLMAVHMLLKRETKWFVLLSAVSIAIKPFYLIVYLGLILLVEKKIWKIALQTLGGLSLLFFSKLLFMNAPLYQESIANGPTQRLYTLMFQSGFETSFGITSYFAIAVIIFLFACYAIKIKSEEELFKYVIYMAFAGNLIYILIPPMYFYRVLLLLPFLYILMMQNRKIFKLNMLIDIFMSFSVIFLCDIAGAGRGMVMNTNFMKNSLLDRLSSSLHLGGNSVSFLEVFTASQTLQRLAPIFIAAFFTGGVLLLIINYPKNRFVENLEHSDCERWIIWIRLFSSAAFILVMWKAYF